MDFSGRGGTGGLVQLRRCSCSHVVRATVLALILGLMVVLFHDFHRAGMIYTRDTP